MDGDWFDGAGWAKPGNTGEIAEIGLPLAYGPEGAALSVLTGDSCLAFSREELRNLLAGGVLADAPALARLNELGLSEYTGFAVEGSREDDTIELLTDDPLNGMAAGRHRDCRQSFKWWSETAYLLRPLSPHSRITAEAIDFAGKRLGAIGGVFENALGGRVAVSGYFPWRFLMTLGKTVQMKALCRWLSQDRLPAYIASFHKIPLWCRRDAAGQPALLLVNASLDPAEEAQLHILGAGTTLRVIRTDCGTTTIEQQGADGPYAVFNLPPLGPWEMVLLTHEAC
ncbi:MAG: hypothetical protein ACYDBB_03405 [Armatimonadota bacterium]